MKLPECLRHRSSSPFPLQTSYFPYFRNLRFPWDEEHPTRLKLVLPSAWPQFLAIDVAVCRTVLFWEYVASGPGARYLSRYPRMKQNRSNCLLSVLIQVASRRAVVGSLTQSKFEAVSCSNQVAASQWHALRHDDIVTSAGRCGVRVRMVERVVGSFELWQRELIT